MQEGLIDPPSEGCVFIDEEQRINSRLVIDRLSLLFTWVYEKGIIVVLSFKIDL